MSDAIRLVKIMKLADRMGWPYRVAEIVFDRNLKNIARYS